MPIGVYSRPSPEQRFWKYVSPEPNTGCWLWTGYTFSSGYSCFGEKYSSYHGHRWAYKHFVGEIPDGWEVDHLCRVRCCVNPSHLEAVEPKENKARGMAPSAVQRRTVCVPQGHELVTMTYCKTCRKASQRRSNRVQYLKRKSKGLV